MKRYNEGGALTILGVLFFLFSGSTSAQYLQENIQYAPNRIVIAVASSYAPLNPVARGGIISTGINEINRLNLRFSVSKMRPLFPGAEQYGEIGMAGYYSLTFSDGFPLEAVLSAYDSLGSVEHVEPVGIHRLYFTPNDPYLSTQWAITKISARQAWDVTRGDPTVPLGIADTGVDWNHPDLNDNIWINSADPIDGVDNDGNGYIDDYRGWDWVDGVNGAPGEDDNTPDNNPMDFAGHGTHVSGIASAETNNGVGVAGVGFSCKIMALRIGWLDSDGFAYVAMDFAASAFRYAANKGAKALNASWGSSNSGGLGAATDYAVSHGVVIVSAAGNNNDQVASYLCSRSDVIAVAATDQNDHKASFSSYGSWVDVSAPGVSIRSTYFDNTYAYLDGTSMSAPHVTGLTGLIRSAAPYMTRAQVQTLIINSTDDIDGINPSYAGLLGSGRINAATAVSGLGGSLAIPIPVFPIGNIWINTPHPTMIWIDTSQATIYHIQLDQNPSFGSPDVNDSSITDTTYAVTDSLLDGTWYWHVMAGIGNLWTDYCASQTFRIDSRKPNSPVLLTPADNVWTNDRTPYFSWQAVTDVGGSGIGEYYIQVDSDSLFSVPRIVDDSTVATNYTPTSNLPSDGRIFWRIRARDNAGNYGNYTSGAFFLDSVAPDSPIGFNATPDAWTANSNFTLNWTNPTDPSGISTALYKIGPIPTSNFDTTGHIPGTSPGNIVFQTTGAFAIYLWLVDGAGNASFLHRAQDTIRFDNTPPSGCVASSPATSPTLSFSVSWTAGTDVGSGLAGLYDVRFKDGVAGVWTDWLVDNSGLSGIFAGLQEHTYYFEARTQDLVGNEEAFLGIAETQTVVDTNYVGPPFVPGDANGSGDVNGLDVVYLVNYLKGGPAPDPLLSADANGSCSVNGIDVSYLINYLKGGPGPYAGNCR